MGRYPRVMVIDPNRESRAEIEQMLEAAPLALVANTADGAEARSLAEEMQPELILAAVEDPADPAIQTIRAVSALLPNSQIIAYSSIGDAKVLKQLMQIGVTDLLPRPIVRAQLMQAIEHAEECSAAPDNGSTSAAGVGGKASTSAPRAGNGAAAASAPATDVKAKAEVVTKLQERRTELIGDLLRWEGGRDELAAAVAGVDQELSVAEETLRAALVRAAELEEIRLRVGLMETYGAAFVLVMQASEKVREADGVLDDLQDQNRAVVELGGEQRQWLGPAEADPLRQLAEALAGGPIPAGRAEIETLRQRLTPSEA
ncbi:MAG: response regulator [Dehalococcoidia bacterium]